MSHGTGSTVSEPQDVLTQSMSGRNEDKLSLFKGKVADIPFNRWERAKIDWKQNKAAKTQRKVEVSKNSLCAPMLLLPSLNPGS